MSPFRRRVLSCAALGALVRVAYVAWLRRAGDFMIGDSWVYHGEGILIAQGKGWIDPFVHAITGFERQLAMHPPGYPAYLALWSVLRVRSVLGHQLATIPIGLTSIVVGALVARQVWGPRAGVIAALVIALHPSFWSWEGMLLQEPLGILASLVLLLAFLRVARTPDTRSFVLAGLAAGLAPLARAELLLAVVMMTVVVALKHRRTLGWPRTFIRTGIAAGVALACLAPWTVYNMVRFERPVLLSNGFGTTLSSANCELLDGELLGYWNLQCTTPRTAAIAAEWAAAHPGAPQRPMASSSEEFQARRGRGERVLPPGADQLRYPELDESVLDGLMRSRTMAWIADHAGFVARSVPARLGRVLGVFRPAQQISLDTFPDGRKRPVAVSAWVVYYALVPFALWGAAMLWKRGARQRTTLAVVLAPLVTALATVAITFGNTRYRAIAEPTFVILAAGSLARAMVIGRARWLTRTGAG